MTTVQEFIQHHGVKGMRWGVRKRRDEKARKQAFESRKVSRLTKKKASELSNRELKLANERMNLEQNYNRLNPTTVAKGKAAAAGILATLGLGVSAYQMVNSPAGKAAIASAKKAIKAAKAANVRPPKGQLTLF